MDDESLALSPSPARDFSDPTALFMALTTGLLLGAILGWPHLDWSPNDASRWNTIYFLVEHGTYEIKPDHGARWPGLLVDKSIDPTSVPADKRADLFEAAGKYYASPGDMSLFYTIDMVKFGEKYYSSKPPLLPTLLAGIVIAVEKVTGIDFREHPRLIMRSTLILAQVIPLLLSIWLISRYVLRSSPCSFVRYFCIAAAAIGTYLAPWSITLNNHVLAACSALFAVYAIVRIWYDERREWYWFAMAGFFSAFTAANELPAAMLLAASLLMMWMKDRRKTILYGLTLALIPIVGFFVTNYLAIGSLKPAYSEFGKPRGGYDYPGSYWRNPTGIDALHEGAGVYLSNILIGHHGFFLLTPIFLLSMIGIFRHLRSKADCRPMLAGMTLLFTAIVVGYYTYRTNNYGGTAQGPRWLFWLIPLWLLFLPGGVEPLARKWYGRAVCYLLLTISLVSVGFTLRQPWAASWAHLLFREWGWITY